MKNFLKHLVLIFVFLSNIFLCNAQAVKLDEKYGFRDLNFGQDVSVIQDLVLIRSSGKHKWYVRSADKLKIRDALLTSIWYRFYKDKLYAIEIIAPLTMGQSLLKELQAAYGDGRDYTLYNDVRWEVDGEKTALTYKDDSASNKAEVEIWSDIIGNQMIADNKNEARKKAQADL